MLQMCSCSCGYPCPFRKSGMATRCQTTDLATHFGCDESEALAKLAEWQENWKPEPLPFPIRIQIVEANRPD